MYFRNWRQQIFWQRKVELIKYSIIFARRTEFKRIIMFFVKFYRVVSSLMLKETYIICLSFFMFSNPFCVAPFLGKTFNAHNITTYDVKYIIKIYLLLWASCNLEVKVICVLRLYIFTTNIYIIHTNIYNIVFL